jgi:hypothetical protein
VAIESIAATDFRSLMFDLRRNILEVLVHPFPVVPKRKANINRRIQFG